MPLRCVSASAGMEVSRAPQKSLFLQAVRYKAGVCRLSARTERAYAGAVSRFARLSLCISRVDPGSQVVAQPADLLGSIPPLHR